MLLCLGTVGLPGVIIKHASVRSHTCPALDGVIALATEVYVGGFKGGEGRLWSGDRMQGTLNREGCTKAVPCEAALCCG